MESVQFAGQQHTWRVSSLLQKGSQRSAQDMQANLSQAVRLLGQHRTCRPTSHRLSGQVSGGILTFNQNSASGAVSKLTQYTVHSTAKFDIKFDFHNLSNFDDPERGEK